MNNTRAEDNHHLRYQNGLKAGNRFFREGKYRAALKEYTAALDLNDDPPPDNPLLERSMELSRLGKHAEAVTFASAYLDYFPLDSETWKFKAAECMALDLPREAEICSRRALQINPEDVENLVFLAYLEADKFQRYERAVECYDRALKIRPRDARVLRLKGVALHNLQRFKEAIGCYNKSLKEDPNEPLTWKDKGDSLNCLALSRKAIAAYKKAVDLSPRDAGLWHILALTYDDLDRNREAREAYQQVLDLAGDDSPELTSHARLAISEMSGE